MIAAPRVPTEPLPEMLRYRVARAKGKLFTLVWTVAAECAPTVTAVVPVSEAKPDWGFWWTMSTDTLEGPGYGLAEVFKGV